MADKIHFGPGCSTIEVDPFEPICGYPEPQKSSASTFEVPLPAFVPPVPPSECVCFDFTSEEVAVTTVRCDQPTKCRVEITPVGDCCDGVYKVTPHIEVPCIPFDIAPAVVTTTVKQGTTPKASFRLEKDCFGCQLKPFLDIEFPIPKIDIPTPCFRVEGDKESGAKFGLTITYTTGGDTVTASAAGKGGRTRAKASAVTPHTVTTDFTVGRDPDVHDCDCYRIGSATIDLGNLGGGGFDNGGDVNLNGDNKLEIDGDEVGNQVWYEGGLGDLATDAPVYLLKRGPLYMRGMGPSSYGKSSAVPVPHVEFLNQQQFLDAGRNVATRWSSRRPDGLEPGFVGGSLDIVAPAGFQWHDRGVAAVMGHWRYNQSGVLSWYESATGAALLSPAPATIGSGSSEKPASGLWFFPTETWDSRNPGLAVNAGNGLRIYGIGDGSVPSGDTDPDGSRQGSLEVQYGRGLAILGSDKKDIVRQSAAAGALTIALASDGGLAFDTDGRLQIDSDEFAAKDHVHGNITADGELSVAGHVVVTGSDNKITFDANLNTADAVALIRASTFGAGALAGERTLRGLAITGTNASTVGLALDGPTRTITFGSGTTASTVSSDNTGAILIASNATSANLIGNTEINLSAPANMTLLANPPILSVEGANGSKAVATCGWVAANFDASSGYTPNKWMKTDSEGKIGTTDEEPLAIDPEKTGFVYNSAGDISYRGLGAGLTFAGDGKLTLNIGNGLKWNANALEADIGNVVKKVLGVNPDSTGDVTGILGTGHGQAAYGDHDHDHNDISDFDTAVDSRFDEKTADFAKKSEDFTVDGHDTFAENELLAHKHFATDILLPNSWTETLSSLVTTDAKLRASKLQVASDGCLSVKNDAEGLQVQVGTVADKWVKTTAGGRLTVSDSDPITADAESTGIVYNTTGTVSYRGLGDGLEDGDSNTTIKVKAKSRDFKFSSKELQINTDYTGTTNWLSSKFNRSSATALYSLPFATMSQTLANLRFVDMDTFEELGPMFVYTNGRYLPNLTSDKVTEYCMKLNANYGKIAWQLLNSLSFGVLGLLPNGVVNTVD